MQNFSQAKSALCMDAQYDMTSKIPWNWHAVKGVYRWAGDNLVKSPIYHDTFQTTMVHEIMTRSRTNNYSEALTHYGDSRKGHWKKCIKSCCRKVARSNLTPPVTHPVLAVSSEWQLQRPSRQHSLDLAWCRYRVQKKGRPNSKTLILRFLVCVCVCVSESVLLLAW